MATTITSDKKEPLPGALIGEGPPDNGSSEVINASGHVQELNRNFNLLSAAGIGLVVGSELNIKLVPGVAGF